jgi:DNA-directed RNA polymerase alpha subunit
MTNKEIKIELAKVALDKCAFHTSDALTDSLKNLYDWIVDESDDEVETNQENQFDSVDIEEVLKIIRRQNFYHNVTIIETIFRRENINTVGDLIRVGGRKFSKYRTAGRKTVSAIADALEELGVTAW